MIPISLRVKYNFLQPIIHLFPTFISVEVLEEECKKVENNDRMLPDKRLLMLIRFNVVLIKNQCNELHVICYFALVFVSIKVQHNLLVLVCQSDNTSTISLWNKKATIGNLQTSTKSKTHMAQLTAKRIQLELIAWLTFYKIQILYLKTTTELHAPDLLVNLRIICCIYRWNILRVFFKRESPPIEMFNQAAYM